MRSKNEVFYFDICFLAIPQHQLPCLQVDGRFIPQSGAIMRYIAREFGTYLLIKSVPENASLKSQSKRHLKRRYFPKSLIFISFNFVIYRNVKSLRKNWSNMNTFWTANILMTLFLYQFGKVKKYKQCAFPACVNFKHVVLN